MPGNRFHILVADDVRLDREILRSFLEKEGYRVTCAEDGLEALDMMETHAFDLVILDIMMPRMYGSKVLIKMRENQMLRHIPVIMMTSLDDVESAAQCIEQGAEGYLTKPHDKTLLMARISNCIQKKKLRDQEKLFLKDLERDLSTSAAAMNFARIRCGGLRDR